MTNQEKIEFIQLKIDVAKLTKEVIDLEVKLTNEIKERLESEIKHCDAEAKFYREWIKIYEKVFGVNTDKSMESPFETDDPM